MIEISEPVIILAGGFGTRLRSVVSDVPKPLAPIDNVPFLHYLLRDLINQGCRYFIISLYHQAELICQFIEHYEKQITADIVIRCVVEPTPLGTGGGVGYVIKKEKLEGTFYVVNGDTYLPNGLKQLHELSSTGCNSIALVSVEDISRYGTVSIDSKQKITKFCEKNTAIGPSLINSGVYRMNTTSFKILEEEHFSMERELFPLLIQNNDLYGFQIKSDFIDIGIPSDYQKLCSYMVNQHPLKIK